MLRAIRSIARGETTLACSGDLPPLHHQVRSKDLNGLRRAMEKTSSSSIGTLLAAVDNQGRNALHTAADLRAHEILKHLLKVLAAQAALNVINAKDSLGCSPLLLAAKAGCRKCTAELLKAGADTSITDTKGNTILHAPFLAPFLSKGHLSSMKEVFALAASAPVNVPNGSGLTPYDPLSAARFLQLACQKGAYDCALLLLAAKADATLVKRGEPPLFYAVATENSALVRRLLEAGADVGQPNQAGQTLMEVLNPKCEIYRVIKQFLVDRPGGQRKLQLISEEVVVATTPSQLTPDILKMIDRSGLSREEVQANWVTFCNVIRAVAKKRVVATTEEMLTLKRKHTLTTDPGTPTPVDTEASAMITSGEPQKIFKKMTAAGRGGFGMVYQGLGPDKRNWAIKRMAHNSTSEKLANLREAKFLKECMHRNICSYKATYEYAAEHEMWLIMELLEGGTLDESVGSASDEARHFFEEKHLAYAACEILKGLEYLHGQNIVHRDLKSQNVMFTLAGEVKIIDFGAAIQITEGSVHKDMIGSPFWMPPEVILRQPHGTPVDIWSMAVCLLELANYRAPDSSSMLRHMFHVATGKRPWLDRPDKWSNLMHDFLEQALQIDPAKRPRATALLHHKWIVSKACSQAEMQRLLGLIFDVRAFADDV